MADPTPVPVSADAATRERRDEWKRLAEAATPGPWESSAARAGQPPIVCYDSRLPASTGIAFISEHPHGDADAEFIAAARIAVPDLIAQVEALESEREALRAELATLRATKDPSIRTGPLSTPIDFGDW